MAQEKFSNALRYLTVVREGLATIGTIDSEARARAHAALGAHPAPLALATPQMAAIDLQAIIITEMAEAATIKALEAVAFAEFLADFVCCI